MNGDVRIHTLSDVAIKSIALIGLSLAIAGLICVFGLTLNQALAISFSMIVVTFWFYDKFAGALSGIIFFITKSLWVRLAFALDIGISGVNGFDLLSITPALVLAALTLIQVYNQLSRGEKICPDKTRGILAIFIAINFLSIFNPASSLKIGLAGFERNIIPNITMLYLLVSVVSERKHLLTLVKVLLILGVVSCAYAIGQYFAGIYPWELDWFRRLAFEEGLSGRLTIGLRGIEFRIFSIFYGYMDFFFTNVLVFALAMTYKNELTGRWRKYRILFFILWTIILILSIERMPIVMTLAIMMVLRYLGASSGKRRKMIWRSVLTAGLVYSTLLIAGPALKSTGVAKLIRLAELANPFEAGSINDRAENKWGPAL
ncbi:MAG TPA: hypothetical protein DCZ43_00300, partial [candidate division Zixibacteria bacterium]|nr:hypothetical protein [candidate division Zixibacteria bacterium]